MSAPNAITVPVPCYRLNGDLWFEDRVLCGAYVSYHLSVTDSTMYRHIPFHALEAITTYRETIRALLLAGF